MKTLMTLLIATASLWSLTLDEAIERAMKNAPAIQKAQSDVRYAEYGELGTEAAFHPVIDAGYNWRDVDNTTAFSYSPAYNYNLTAKYNLFSGFTDKSLMDAQALTTEAQRLLLTAKQADVRLDVINAYAALLKAQKAVETQQDALDSLERSYNDTKVRYEQGIVAKNELLLIDVQRLGAEQALVTAKSGVVRSRDNLGRVLGGSVESDEAINEISGDVSPISDINVLSEQMYTNRSELRALYKLREALDERYTAATGTFYPRVDLSADYTVNDKELLFGGSTVQHKDLLTTTVNVSWNLYNGRANEAQRKQVLAQSQAQDADIEAMKLDLRYQLADAFETYRVAQSARDVATRAKESAEENFRITNDRYEYGDVDTLTLLQAQSDLTAARNAYNNAFYDLYVAVAAIERIAGE
jgi:outer membrane protein TolC